MPERPKYLRDSDAASRASIQSGVRFGERDNYRDFARSAHGQNYNKMMDMQNQLPGMTRDDPRVQEFKDRRRAFNRYGKYPMGEMFGDSPQEMQNKYAGLSGDVRDVNKSVYNKMYPATGAYHHYTDVGGLTGLLARGAVGAFKGAGDVLSGLFDRTGIFGTSKASDEATQENVENYLEKTFPSDVHPGTAYAYEHPDDMGLYDDEEVYGGPRPHEDMRYLSDEAAAIQNEFTNNPYFQDLAGENVVLPYEKERRGHPHLETYVPDPEVFGETSVINEPSPMDLESRQMGRYGVDEMPTSRKSDWEDYLSYVQRLGDMPGGHLEYDEWHDMMRRRR